MPSDKTDNKPSGNKPPLPPYLRIVQTLVGIALLIIGIVFLVTLIATFINDPMKTPELIPWEVIARHPVVLFAFLIAALGLTYVLAVLFIIRDDNGTAEALRPAIQAIAAWIVKLVTGQALVEDAEEQSPEEMRRDMHWVITAGLLFLLLVLVLGLSFFSFAPELLQSPP
jgi:hypothetical protein